MYPKKAVEQLLLKLRVGGLRAPSDGMIKRIVEGKYSRLDSWVYTFGDGQRFSLRQLVERQVDMLTKKVESNKEKA